jgi:hypothetical protein
MMFMTCPLARRPELGQRTKCRHVSRQNRASGFSTVMPGLVPGIHVLDASAHQRRVHGPSICIDRAAESPAAWMAETPRDEVRGAGHDDGEKSAAAFD